MSLYHETASVLDGNAAAGGNLRSRVFNSKDLKSPRGQVYALAVESCKWSTVLSEVIEHSQLLQHERKLTPVLSLLLVHDFLLAKGGIALPASHGLRTTIERHRSRLTAELSRARIRRRCASVEALAEHVEASLHSRGQHPRWVRVNTLRSTLDDQLATTFEGYQRTGSVREVLGGTGKRLYVDEHIPDLVAVHPRFDFARSQAYRTGAIILQDKASCFPAYLLDPQPDDGHVIDGCAAPGNKTTHLAAIIRSRAHGPHGPHASIYAFEKDAKRAKTLEKMVEAAGSGDFTQIHQGQDFLKVNPSDEKYRRVGAILLDPSCSGSGIVGRDDMPDLHLPAAAGARARGAALKSAAGATPQKRKRQDDDSASDKVLVDDDGNTTVAASEGDLQARLKALSDFQLAILLHAFRFPAAWKITYSTCSVHAEENEHVVLRALRSDIARQRGWRVLPRGSQVSGMRAWPVRGQVDACDGNSEVADACIRTYKDDGRAVMGFFVAAFTRDGGSDDEIAVPAAGAQRSEDVPAPPRRSKKAPRGDDRPAGSPLPDVTESGIDGQGVEAADLSGESDWGGFDD